MKKLTLSMIVFAGIATSTFAQKDSTVKTPVIKKDTVKSKETGAVNYSETNMIAVAITPEDSSKTKSKPKIKADTLKTGAIKITEAAYYALYSPQTDSVKPKSKEADTIKTDTKSNETGYFKRAEINEMIAYSSSAAGPQTDSSKTKPATIKSDTIAKPAPDKKTGSLYFDRNTASIMALPREMKMEESYYSEV